MHEDQGLLKREMPSHVGTRPGPWVAGGTSAQDPINVPTWLSKSVSSLPAPDAIKFNLATMPLFARGGSRHSVAPPFLAANVVVWISAVIVMGILSFWFSQEAQPSPLVFMLVTVRFPPRLESYLS